MSNTFLPLDTPNTTVQTERPCVAVADLTTGRLSCAERRRAQTEEDDQESWRVTDVRFASGSERKLTVHYQSGWSATYIQSSDDSWSADKAAGESVPQNHPIDVHVKEDLNEPPVLIAVDQKKTRSRLVWNPNPQLKNVQLGGVSVFKWNDKTGRGWVGGLYKPPDYVNGRRYPLVIQTHGFDEREFRPSGSFSTAFAAQELAAVGILVLQVEDCPVRVSQDEGPCQVAGYEAAVQQLSTDGLVDPNRVGIIGFSRTCYYVLQALTAATLRFNAASITDGFDEGYLQYIMQVDNTGNSIAHEADAMIGASPFGAGLVQWLRRAPDFNMEKVDTPLQVVALGRVSLLSMWEPYAALRYLRKPVDLVVLNSDEHILTNPAARMASQGGTVDWFRFWLQGFEDLDPAKAEQYVRWRQLRDAQTGK
jgi:dienelactone hydrolase